MSIWSEDIRDTSEYTFQVRLNYLIKLICFWKSRCEDFKIGNRMQECVALPHKKMLAALSNKKMNANRQAWLDEGRAVSEAAPRPPRPTHGGQGTAGQDVAGAEQKDGPGAPKEEAVLRADIQEASANI